MLSTKIRRTTLLDRPKRRAMPEHTPAMTRSLDGRARLAMVAGPSSCSGGRAGRAQVPPCPGPAEKARVGTRDPGLLRVGPGRAPIGRHLAGWARDADHRAPLRRPARLP